MSHAFPLRTDFDCTDTANAAACAQTCAGREAAPEEAGRAASESPLIPLRDYIVVRLDATREDVTSAGIVVRVGQTIESQRQLGRTGVIVACGPGVRGKDGRRIPLRVRNSDRVVFGEFLHKEIQHDGERYVMLREADVCAVLESA